MSASSFLLSRWAALAALGVLGWAGPTAAQSPVVGRGGLVPAANAWAAPRTTTVAVPFSELIDPATANNIKVFSAQYRGRRTATAAVSGNMVTLTPTAPSGTAAFRPGEKVEVAVPASVHSVGGAAATPMVYRFTTAAGVGPATFFQSSTVQNPTFSSPVRHVAMGDVDGDGDADMVVSSFNGSFVAVRLNDGTGVFSGGTDLSTGGTAAQTSALGDIDGDGDLDILVAGIAGSFNGVLVFRNQGAGTFSSAVQVSTYSPSDIAVGDLDGDADLDFVVTSYAGGGGNTVSAFRNDGTGAFTLASTVSVAAGPYTLTLGDIDSDGDLDVAVAGTGTVLTLLLNNGQADFTPQTISGSTSYVTLGDVDHDGDLDLLTSDVNASAITIRRNTGTGAFTAGTTTLTGGTRAMELADMDGDGDLDLLTSGPSGASVMVRLNDGTGTFSQHPTVPEAEAADRPWYTVPSDIDGDGDLDVLSVGDGTTATILFNRPTPNPPTISGFTPATGSYGTTVTVTGTNLVNASAVTINGVAATYTVTSTTELTLTVPPAATTGPISVTRAGSTATTSAAFTVVPVPYVASFTPTAAVVGASVTITGNNFTGATGVQFNGSAATFTVSSATSITTSVPAGATSGPITVTNPSGTGTSTGSFTVRTAAISSMLPLRAPVGSLITFKGGGFSGVTAVTFSTNLPAAFTISGDTMIVATVPTGTRSGVVRITLANGTVLNSPRPFALSANAAPTGLTLAPTTVNENVAANTTVGTFTSTDADAGGVYTYTLVAGAGSTDNAAFSISDNALHIVASPDFETQSSYAIRVRTTDQGGLFFEQTFTITVTDLPEALTVSTAQTVAAGTYTTLTVTGTGTATLGADVVVTDAVIVEAGGVLADNCHVLSGSATFTLAANATLRICAAQGLTSIGATGAVQTTGTRTFSPHARYIYLGGAQVTGAGLPSAVRALTKAGAGTLTLSGPVAIREHLTLSGAGNVDLNGHALTLKSTADTSAYVVNASTGGVVGNTAAVQRYITPNPGAAIGYRFFSAPVSGSTVADFAAPGFTPVINGVYNTATNYAAVRPHPTVYGFDETRSPALNDFSKGYFAPLPTGVPASSQAITAPLVVGRGYSLECPATTYDFVGTLNTGTVTLGGLTRTGTTSKAGWHLLGNPYPAPIDWDRVAVPAGMSSTIYVQKTLGGNDYVYLTRQSNGDGTGAGTLTEGELAIAQGFFAEVTTTNTSFSFTNAHRLTTAANPPHYRPASAPRPTLSLTLRDVAATNPAAQDEAFVVFHETGATAAYDEHADGRRPGYNGGVPTLATLLPSGEELAIDGRPTADLTAGTLIELLAVVPAAGSYKLSVGELTSLDGATVVLRDRLTGTGYDLTTQPTVGFTADRAGTIRGRFALELNLLRVTGLPAALAAPKLALYPNPATGGTVRLSLPTGTPASATILDAAGRTVRTALVPADGILDVRGLAPGVYAVRVGSATARLVLE